MGWLKRLFSTPKLDLPDQRATREPREPARSQTRRTPARVTPTRREPDWRSYDWEDVAEAYAKVLAPMMTEPYRDLLALAGRTDASRSVLDIGAGTGEELTGLDGLVVGVDASQRMLLEGRKRAPGVRVAAADLIDLPFRAAAFDIVTASFVLPEVTKLDTALFDMIRVIKPGGVLGVSVWTEVNDDLTRTWRDLALEKLGPELLRDAFRQGAPWMDKLADAKHVEQVMRDAGLRSVRVEKRRYRNELARDDYVRGKEVEVVGRYLHRMLGAERWEAFKQAARDRFAQRFGERIVDFRDVLLAVGTKPRA
jgi:ubiquinone/menaquinone biosynthesis C-methylase UbiE